MDAWETGCWNTDNSLHRRLQRYLTLGFADYKWVWQHASTPGVVILKDYEPHAAIKKLNYLHNPKWHLLAASKPDTAKPQSQTWKEHITYIAKKVLLFCTHTVLFKEFCMYNNTFLMYGVINSTDVILLLYILLTVTNSKSTNYLNYRIIILVMTCDGSIPTSCSMFL